MAEKKMQIDNIKIIAEILKDGGIDLLKNGFSDSEKRIREFKALIDGKLAVIAEQKAAEAAKAAEEELKSRAEETAQAAAEISEADVKPAEQPAPAAPESAAKAEESVSAVEKPAVENKADVKAPTSDKKEEKKMPSFIVRREFVPDKNAGADRAKNRTFTPTDKPFGKKPDFKAGARRPQAAYVAPPIIPTEDKRGAFNKKNSGKGEKNY